MSHDCDCDSCQATDSRWAPHRATQRALKEDCPFGRHVADLWRSHGANGEPEYKCKHCNVWVTESGKAKEKAVNPKEWSIGDRYFYQAGPLPEDRDEEERKKAKAITDLVKCPCKDHRTYKALRRPRSSCEVCWRFFVKMNP